MKKFTHTFIFLCSMLLVFSACSGDSYEKRVKKQKKAIDRFLSDKDILYTYPANHHFEKNQYYKEPNTSIYYQIVDAGKLSDSMTTSDKERANIPVTIMFDSIFQLVSGVASKGDYVQTGEPVRFTYGKTSTYTPTSGVGKTYMSQSLVLPLEKGLGSGAIVNILVPFQNGSSYQQSYYEPFYYQTLRYTYYKQINVPENQE